MHDPHSTHPGPPATPRRTFLTWMIHSLSAVFAAVLGFPAIAYLIDARNRKVPDSSFKTVAKLSELVVDDPKQFVIRNERRDAWTLHPNDIIGRVWLVRRAGDKVEAFTTICPHLGCSINFDDPTKSFICPCHGGTWDDKGNKVELPMATNPAPRAMDSLECKIDAQGSVLVEYKNFYPGHEEKTAKQ